MHKSIFTILAEFEQWFKKGFALQSRLITGETYRDQLYD